VENEASTKSILASKQTTEVQEGQLHFQERSNTITLLSGPAIEGQFLSDRIGRKMDVLVVDCVAIQVRRR
jgi:hypothetical protein